MPFNQATRNRLQRFVNDARSLLVDEFTRQLQQEYGLDPKTGEAADLSKLSHLDDSHLETVRYGKGSNFWKILGAPLTHGKNIGTRIGKLSWYLISKPGSWLGIYFKKDFSRRSVILMVMQHLDSTIRFKKGLFNLKSTVSSGSVPSAFMPMAKSLANITAKMTFGKPFVLFTEALTGTPTTAHILGGSVIGDSPENGVVDKDQKVFGYENMYVCDGSAISANPGVNPALTITAMTERVMEKIPEKSKILK